MPADVDPDARFLLANERTLLVGALSGLAGYGRYRAADRAIRRGELPPASLAPEGIALAVVVLAVLLLAIAISDEFGA